MSLILSMMRIDPQTSNIYQLPKPQKVGDTGKILKQLFNAIPSTTEVVFFYLNIHGCGTGGEPEYFVFEGENNEHIQVAPLELIGAFKVLHDKNIKTLLKLHACAGTSHLNGIRKFEFQSERFNSNRI